MLGGKKKKTSLNVAVTRDDDALWRLVWGHLRDVKSVKSIRTDKASLAGPPPSGP